MSFKVLTVVGTRPELIRLSRVIDRLDSLCSHVLVHTGQNFDRNLSDVFFEELGIRQPDYRLNSQASKLGDFLGGILPKIQEIIEIEQPNAFLILGDTNSALSCIVAKRLGIPVYHVEAGNRSFDSNVPEELNRRSIDHTSDFNMVYSEAARRNLLNEGMHPRDIVLVGSPMSEVIDYYRNQIIESRILENLALESKGYFVVSAHRQENVDDPIRLQAFLDSLKFVYSRWRLPVIVSLHPRTRLRLRQLEHTNFEGIQFLEPFGFFDYCKLQASAFCVLSDSGTISEESTILGFPAVSIRKSMERPEALETSAITLSDFDSDSLTRSIDFTTDPTTLKEAPHEYLIKNTSSRIVNFIFSSAGNHKQWHGLN